MHYRIHAYACVDSSGIQTRLLGVATVPLEGVDVLARSRKVDFVRNVKAVTSAASPDTTEQESKSVRVGCCTVRVHFTSEDEPAATPVEDGALSLCMYIKIIIDTGI